MTRQIPGLSQSSRTNTELPDGAYLSRVARVYYRWDKHKPFYIVHFEIVEPSVLSGRIFNGRLYATTKALWKLNWFLHDFGYDPELLGRDEIDERALRGLIGIVRIAHKTIDEHSVLNLEAFAPANRWNRPFASDGQEAA